MNSLYETKWLRDTVHLKITAYYFREWENWSMQMHSHNQTEIMYVIKGNCSVLTKDETFDMHKGDLVLIDAGALHRLCIAKNETCRMLNVEFEFKNKDNSFPCFKDLVLDNASLKFLLESRKPCWFLKDTEEIYPVFKNLVMELDKNPSECFMTQLLLAQIMIKISSLAKQSCYPNKISGSIYVKKAVEYIHQHYDQNIKAEHIASAVNIHKGHLYRVFKMQLGKTPLDYLNDFRLEKAKMLLAGTDIPIIDICYYVGINSRQYFSAVFKKYTNMAPAAYRKSFDSVLHQNKNVTISDI